MNIHKNSSNSHSFFLLKVSHKSPMTDDFNEADSTQNANEDEEDSKDNTAKYLIHGVKFKAVGLQKKAKLQAKSHFITDVITAPKFLLVLEVERFWITLGSYILNGAQNFCQNRNQNQIEISLENVI